MKKHTFLAVALVGILADQGVNGWVEGRNPVKVDSALGEWRQNELSQDPYAGYDQSGTDVTFEEAYLTHIVEAEDLTFKVQKLDERDEAFRRLRAAMVARRQFMGGLDDETAYYWIRLDEEREREFLENKRLFAYAGKGETPRLGMWDRETGGVAFLEPRGLFLKYFNAYRQNPGPQERERLKNIVGITLWAPAAERLADIERPVRPEMAFDEMQELREIEVLLEAIEDERVEPYEKSVAGEIKVDLDKGTVTPIVYAKYSREAVNIEDKVAKAEKR